MSQPSDSNSVPRTGVPHSDADSEEPVRQPICPICGGPLIEIRAKLQCQRCHTILETCCEGGRQ
jgi:hypothetical protein